MRAETARNLLDGAVTAQRTGRHEESGHLLILGCRRLVELAAEDRLFDLMAAIQETDPLGLQMVAGALAEECARAAWVPQGDPPQQQREDDQ